MEKVEGGEGQSHCLGCLMHQDLGYGVGQGDDIRKLGRGENSAAVRPGGWKEHCFILSINF